MSRVDLDDWSTIATLNLTATDPGLAGFVGGFVDDANYAYFLPYSNEYTTGSPYSGKVRPRIPFVRLHEHSRLISSHPLCPLADGASGPGGLRDGHRA